MCVCVCGNILNTVQQMSNEICNDLYTLQILESEQVQWLVAPLLPEQASIVVRCWN